MPQDPLLEAVGGANAGTPVLLPDGSQVVAGDAYAAASGRSCRFAQLRYPDGRVERRLACEVDGSWRWFPVVTAPQNS